MMRQKKIESEVLDECGKIDDSSNNITFNVEKKLNCQL